jgi:hypothetical protein
MGNAAVFGAMSSNLRCIFPFTLIDDDADFEEFVALGQVERYKAADLSVPVGADTCFLLVLEGKLSCQLFVAGARVDSASEHAALTRSQGELVHCWNVDPRCVPLGAGVALEVQYHFNNPALLNSRRDESSIDLAVCAGVLMR